MAGLLAVSACLAMMQAEAAVSLRSFFGIHRIVETPDGPMRLLMHGTTVHGAMRLAKPDGSPEPLVYYTPEGPLGTAIREVRAARGGSLGRVAVVGLGTGSLACHRAGDEAWRFYEIDPVVARIAAIRRNSASSRPAVPTCRWCWANARLTLAEAPGGLGALVVDAFSSDAIPAHLLTREALALYLAKLAPDGVLAMHITNRHLDLGRILARVGAEFGLSTHVARESFPFDPVAVPRREHGRGARPRSRPSRRARDRSGLGADRPDLARRPWTDDFSNILQAMADKRALPRRSDD